MLCIEHISFGYNQVQVIKDLSLSVSEGEIHGLLGDNGAGKTTLFHLIFGLLKTGTGSIHYRNKAVTSKEVAYLETEHYFYPYMTGQEYLNLVNGYAENPHIDLWNELFGLPLEERIDAYSTGMKKKLGFLGVLMLNKKIIILDEPFNGLDLKTSEIIHTILLKLKEKNRIILLSSHILTTLTDSCDKISFLDKGTGMKCFDKTQFHSLKELVWKKFRTDVSEKIDGLISP